LPLIIQNYVSDHQQYERLLGTRKNQLPLIKTDTTAKKHEELKCVEEKQRDDVDDEKSFFLPFFSLILSTHLFVILSPVVAVV
jgi:hypothetical protein